MSESKRKVPPETDLTLLNVEEWGRVEEGALELRLMLAGTGFRFTRDAQGKETNPGLAADIGLIQVVVQRLIDRAHANERALRRWIAEGGEVQIQPQPALLPAPTSAPLLTVRTAAFEQLGVAVEKLLACHDKLKALFDALGAAAKACGDEALALRLVELMEAIGAEWQLVKAARQEIIFIANSCDPDDKPSESAGVH